MQDKDKIEDADDISIEFIGDDDEEFDPALPEAKPKSDMHKEAEEADLEQTMEIAWAAMETQTEQLKKENAVLKDQLLRKQAEFDNYRRRTEREKVEARVGGRRAVLVEM